MYRSSRQASIKQLGCRALTIQVDLRRLRVMYKTEVTLSIDVTDITHCMGIPTNEAYHSGIDWFGATTTNEYVEL